MKVSENKICTLSIFSHEVKNISVRGGKFCLRSEEGGWHVFLKSQKINRVGPRL
jgi:hypothetical protein